MNRIVVIVIAAVVVAGGVFFWQNGHSGSVEACTAALKTKMQTFKTMADMANFDRASFDPAECKGLSKSDQQAVIKAISGSMPTGIPTGG